MAHGHFHTIKTFFSKTETVLISADTPPHHFFKDHPSDCTAGEAPRRRAEFRTRAWRNTVETGTLTSSVDHHLLCKMHKMYLDLSKWVVRIIARQLKGI